ncbi:hypothetical protein HMI54_015283 [Coelomomyces lativittatus]|nr:hypothetical protein HMI54_015283 [Coelomomyces lativittatus]
MDTSGAPFDLEKTFHSLFGKHPITKMHKKCIQLGVFMVLILQLNHSFFSVIALTYNDAAFQFSSESKWMGLSLFSFLQGGSIWAHFQRIRSSAYILQKPPISDQQTLLDSASFRNTSSLNVTSIHSLSIFTCPLLSNSSLFHRIAFSANSGWMEDNFPTSYVFDKLSNLEMCALLLDPSTSCQLQLVYRKSYLFTMDPLTNKISPLPYPDPSFPDLVELDPIQLMTPYSAVYLTGLVKCPLVANPDIKFSVSGELSLMSTNPRPFYINPFQFHFPSSLSQLPSGLHPLLSLYPVFFVLYSFIVYFWKAHFHRLSPTYQALPTPLLSSTRSRWFLHPLRFLYFLIPSPILLQQLLFFSPLLRWIYTLYQSFYYSFLSQYGSMHVMMEVTRVLLLGSSLLPIYLVLLFISKGFSITRTRFAGVEARSVLGLVMFLTISGNVLSWLSMELPYFIRLLVLKFFLFWKRRK